MTPALSCARRAGAPRAAYAAGVANPTDLMVPPLTINFWVKMQQATSETVALRNSTVVRYPAQ
ncbi:MAG: hypothetical protein DMG57_35295 [Acidobacteria bacterium]|nr:MAG: hypothetical protein DMG57_35295 [Acidobacteriota bacterium]